MAHCRSAVLLLLQRSMNVQDAVVMSGKGLDLFSETTVISLGLDGKPMDPSQKGAAAIGGGGVDAWKRKAAKLQKAVINADIDNRRRLLAACGNRPGRGRLGQEVSGNPAQGHPRSIVSAAAGREEQE